MGKRKKSMKDIFGCEYVDEDPLLQFWHILWTIKT